VSVQLTNRELSTAAQIERRAHVRVKLDGSITAQPLGGDLALVLEEASIAGFSAKSSVAFEPNSTVHLRLSDAAGQAVLVGAVCRYCTALDGSDSPVYLVGFQLQSPPPRREELVLGMPANDAS
jgi:hypothetical protein